MRRLKNTYKILPILVFLFFANPYSIHSQTQKENCQALIEQGRKAERKGTLTKALEYFLTANIIAKKHPEWAKINWTIKDRLGGINRKLFNYEEAFNWHSKALEITKRHPDSLKYQRANSFNNLGVLYLSANKPKKAIEYYKKSYEIAKDEHIRIKMISANNIADFYYKKGELEKASKVLAEIKKEFGNDKDNQFWKITYAQNLIALEKLGEAKRVLEDYLKNNSLNPRPYYYVIKLLAEIYEAQGNIELSIGTLKKGIRNTPSLSSKMRFYQQLSQLYYNQKKFEAAWIFNDSVSLIRDSLKARMNKQLLEALKVEMSIQNYKNKLKINTERQKAERKIFIIAIVFFLILVFFIFKSLRSRAIKQKQKKELLENKQKIMVMELEQEKKDHLLLEQEMQTVKEKANLKQEKLKNRIAEKNRKLSAKALYLSSRDQLIEDIIASIERLPGIMENKKVRDDIRTLKNHLKTDTEWDEFITYFEKVNPNFLKTLKNEHPKLSANDLRFLCYVYMNLNLKEISIIFNITYNAARIRRKRIKEKMGIDEKNYLYPQLLKID